jgi:hypothetical protein
LNSNGSEKQLALRKTVVATAMRMSTLSRQYRTKKMSIDASDPDAEVKRLYRLRNKLGKKMASDTSLRGAYNMSLHDVQVEEEKLNKFLKEKVHSLFKILHPNSQQAACERNPTLKHMRGKRPPPLQIDLETDEHTFSVRNNLRNENAGLQTIYAGMNAAWQSEKKQVYNAMYSQIPEQNATIMDFVQTNCLIDMIESVTPQRAKEMIQDFATKDKK